MRIQRTIPPSAAPLDGKSIVTGLAGIFSPQRYLEKLEDELRTYFGAKHVFLASSGKTALTLILNALQSLSPEKREVLIPAYTCFSVPSSIVKAGLTVALCDIDPSTFDYNYPLLEHAVSERTLCVISTHLFGIPSDVDRIRALCNNNRAFIVEDAAQAMGGSRKGKKLGTIGDVGFFSLGRGKNITCGSGGIIVTNSDQIAQAIRPLHDLLRQQSTAKSVKEFLKVMVMSVFIHPSLYWLPAGLPFLKLGQTIFFTDFPMAKLSGTQAGILKNWQKRLDESNRIRSENADFFSEVSDLQFERHDRRAAPLVRMPVMVENKEERDRIYSEARKMGLGIGLMYPTPINEIRELGGRLNGSVYCSAKQVSERLVTIPTHGLLSSEDKQNILMLFRKHRTLSGSFTPAA